MSYIISSSIETFTHNLSFGDLPIFSISKPSSEILFEINIFHIITAIPDTIM